MQFYSLCSFLLEVLKTLAAKLSVVAWLPIPGCALSLFSTVERAKFGPYIPTTKCPEASL